MTIPPGYQMNFETLVRASRDRRLALVEMRERATGQLAYVVCALSTAPDDQVDLMPLARLLDGDPFQLFDPPDPNGGFFEVAHDHQRVVTLPRIEVPDA